MSRSGYVNDEERPGQFALYRRRVENAIADKRGQKLLRDLAAAMDAMPEKVLASGVLADEDGNVCALGAALRARAIPIPDIAADDWGEEENEYWAKVLDVAPCMFSEIEFLNDEYAPTSETPQQRWQRMRTWVASNLKETP